MNNNFIMSSLLAVVDEYGFLWYCGTAEETQTFIDNECKNSEDTCDIDFKTVNITEEILNSCNYRGLRRIATAIKRNNSESYELIKKGDKSTEGYRKSLLELFISTPAAEVEIPAAPATEAVIEIPAVPTPVEEKTPTAMVKVPVLFRNENGTTTWGFVESKRLYKAPMNDLQVLDSISLILEGNDKYKSPTFQFKKTEDPNIKNKDFVEPYKLKAIFEKVVGKGKGSLCITYFAQCRLIARVQTSRGDKYMIGKKMHQVLMHLRNMLGLGK